MFTAQTLCHKLCIHIMSAVKMLTNFSTALLYTERSVRMTVFDIKTLRLLKTLHQN